MVQFEQNSWTTKEIVTKSKYCDLSTNNSEEQIELTIQDQKVY